MYFIVALGNPGEEYAKTRHNAGRIVLEEIQKKIGAGIFEKDRNVKALVSKGEIAATPVKLVEPETFMNNSGRTVKSLITSKERERLIVVYDDIDIPLDKIKISFNRSSGGHNGVQSIIDYLKSEEFIRIRVGICPVNEKGEMKKPIGEENVEKFILGKFQKKEIEILEKQSEKILNAIETIITEGKEKAMTKFN